MIITLPWFALAQKKKMFDSQSLEKEPLCRKQGCQIFLGTKKQEKLGEISK
jgi:hypothetical protein